jgi:(p)ppGpp synthase/HD superfamily hydrolase
MFTPERYVAALRFAAERHAAQKVPGTELPYLVHVTSVAAEVISVLPQTPDIDADFAVACALLHDTVEDTATTYADLVVAFGPRVADGVRALSKSTSDELTKLERMTDSLRRIGQQPREVWMVKLADRITNLAPPPVFWTRDKCRAYRDEAIVIADALGAASAALDARIRGRIAAYATHC